MQEDKLEEQNYRLFDEEEDQGQIQKQVEDEIIIEESIREKRLGIICFLLLGIGGAITRNAIFTSIDFFQLCFKDYQTAFLFPIPQFLASNIFSALIILYQYKINFQLQMYATYFIIFIITVIMPTLSYQIQGDKGFALAQCLNFTLGFASAINQACALSFANSFQTTNFVIYYIIGTGLAGVLVAFIKILVLEFSYKSQNYIYKSTITYFLIAGFIIIIVNIYTYFYRKRPYVLQALSKKNQKNQLFQDLLNSVGFINQIKYQKKYYEVQLNKIENNNNNYQIGEIYQQWIDNNEQNIKLQEVYMQIKIKELEEESQVDINNNKQVLYVGNKSVEQIIQEVVRHISVNGVMIWLNFVISYSLFPGVMFKKNYTNISTTWHTAILVANYNLFGTIGKVLAIYKIYSHISASILVLCRFIFFITFFLIVFNDSILSSYAFCQINVALFAFTEGYAQSAHLNLAANKLQNSFRKTLGAYIMGFPIQFGLLSGSLLGYIFKFYL